jgi:hypothetical protein
MGKGHLASQTTGEAVEEPKANKKNELEDGGRK